MPAVLAMLTLLVAFAATCSLALATARASATAAVLTVKVPRPPTARATPGSPLVLHVEDLKLPPGSSGHVRVYADLAPDAEAQLATAPSAEPTTADPHYLGSFNVPPKNSVEAAQGIERKSVILDVTDKASRLSASAMPNKAEVALTFVALRAPATGASPEAASLAPRIGRAWFADK